MCRSWAGYLTLALFATLSLQAQTVTLAWKPSVSSRIARYNVYYSPAGSSVTNLVSVGLTNIATLTNLQPGQAYSFAVTAINVFGRESKHSLQITSTLPRAHPAIVWNSATNLVFGTPLQSSQFGGTSDVPGTFSFKPALGTVLPAGNRQLLTVVFTPEEPKTYFSATNRVLLNVIKAPLVITANNTNKVYGAPLPALTASYRGFVDGNSIANLRLKPVLRAAVTARSPVGEYPITISGAVDPNYEITYVEGSLTVIPATAPSIVTEPRSTIAVLRAPASFTATVAGSSPLTMQWYKNGVPIARENTSALSWASVLSANAGSYYLKAANIMGAVTSSVVTLTVIPATNIAKAAGTYNGLFYSTHPDGTLAVTETNSGFLGNLLVAGNGAFSGRLYLDGSSFPPVGKFDSFGTSTNAVRADAIGLSNLVAVLNADLSGGTRRITGAISYTATEGSWTSPLLAVAATNSQTGLTGAQLLFGVESGGADGMANVVVRNGVATLLGTLADGASFTQTVPISKDGDIPFYASLYNRRGIIEGWITLSPSNNVAGNLIWIPPGGAGTPLGALEGLSGALRVTGTALGR